MTGVLDVAAEQRWSAWKIEGARREVVRAERMRMVFTALVVAPLVWLLWTL